MIVPPSGVRVWLATGATDMRRGMNSLALQVQEALHRDPHAGDLYVFRGKRGDLLKILWHDGLGMPTRSTEGGAQSKRQAKCAAAADVSLSPALALTLSSRNGVGAAPGLGQWWAHSARG